jgi:tRNA nucleotidyltransferase (CCA-adding enzyme)
MFHYQDGWTDGAVRRLVRKVGVERLTDLWEIRRADAWGRGFGIRAALSNLKALKKRIDKILAKDAALKVTDLDINGNELMKALGLDPGPMIGKILDELLECVLDNPANNEKQNLVKIAKGLLKDLNRFSTEKSKKTGHD